MLKHASELLCNQMLSQLIIIQFEPMIGIMFKFVALLNENNVAVVVFGSNAVRDV